MYSTVEYLPEQNSNPKREVYLKVLKHTSLVKQLLAKELSFEWTATKMISDDPVKGLDKHHQETLLINKLAEIIGQPESTVLLVTPYFVPTKTGVKAFAKLVNSGVSISVLTNSMQATDVLPVHSGYAKHRKALLKSGVKLYEFRPSIENSDGRLKKMGPFGSSASNLHAKTFVIDSKRLFIGSFNFDPRSIHLNTELGFIIESEFIASQVEDEFYQQVDLVAYQLSLDESGDIVWTERNGDETVLHNNEPGMTFFSRSVLSILSVLPIDWLL